MRLIRMFVSLGLSLQLLLPLSAQQVTEPTGATLLRRSVAAQIATNRVSDVTFKGTARRIAGSDDETGPAVLKALVTGQSRVDLSFGSGSRSEVVSLGNQCLVGSWKGPDGVAHPIANHNLMSDTSWFFPAFAAARLFSSAKQVVSHAGTEKWNERSVEHLSLNQPDSTQVVVVPRLSHLTQMDLYLDSSTLLPARLTFNTHPDNDVGIDIPVEIVFSDYHTVNGVQVAFHIQKSINNSLTLDFQAEAVEFNTNLTSAAFSAE